MEVNVIRETKVTGLPAIMPLDESAVDAMAAKIGKLRPLQFFFDKDPDPGHVVNVYQLQMGRKRLTLLRGRIRPIVEEACKRNDIACKKL